MFATVPHDLLACFLRGYAYRPDWAETSYVELLENIEWREAHDTDALLGSPPANRDLFELLNQVGHVYMYISRYLDI